MYHILVKHSELNFAMQTDCQLQNIFDFVNVSLLREKDRFCLIHDSFFLSVSRFGCSLLVPCTFSITYVLYVKAPLPTLLSCLTSYGSSLLFNVKSIWSQLDYVWEVKDPKGTLDSVQFKISTQLLVLKFLWRWSLLTCGKSH